MPQDPYAAVAQPTAGSDPYAAIATAPPATSPSKLSHFGHEFLSGLGITSEEDAKNFFLHPVNTAIQALNGQGALAVKARQAFNRGDYKSAAIHSINYLIPFLGQQTDKAGEQLSQGDYAGGAGRTLGVGTGIVAGAKAPEIVEGAGNAAAAAGSAAKPVVASAARTASDIVDPELTGVVSPRLAHLQRVLGKAADAMQKKPSVPVAAAELDATGENKPFAGGMDEYIPKKFSELDATGENKPFAGGMDEAIPAKASPTAAPSAPPTPAASAAESVVIPQRAAPPVPKAIDPILARLRQFAAKIQDEQAAAPKEAAVRSRRPSAPVIPASDDDLLDLLHRSLKEINQKAANQ